MGWSSVSNQRGKSTLEMLRDHTSYREGAKWDGSEGVTYHIERMVSGAGGAYGILAKIDARSEKTTRCALVIAVSRGRTDFAWKSMTEQEGPVICGMPKGMLSKLTPVAELDCSESSIENAREWRARVLARSAPASLVVNVGDVLEFTSPLRFNLPSGSVAVSQLRVESWGRRKRFLALNPTGGSFVARLSRRALSEPFKINPQSTAAATP
ncbi:MULTISPECIES: DUF6927 domain-containing protein [unclassified Variovorax]|uniref:DUF6927 domain-containing protein n=1 Tax=unclassified Variovorax TaxID=663243 RepID=UPI00076C22D7|nr:MULTISPECIES: hypothetical protein [unclassified Variovorax]KWT86095.1 hypothetical protein APY03_3799 [Variovorax sp. WDL1]PNG50084.1 hypothetical protein CHC06_05707 [Variovorax sp. B2]PNG50956.1 hypothetical protein CHC07_05612 [Variovorax sp. B4]VTU41740.1 hypothetical protein SRS16P1_00120 [Variovorax sp. SRS16]VTU41779.1 hypothetical protein E5P1_00120 [Variovorax sp. PBL-E5]